MREDRCDGDEFFMELRSERCATAANEATGASRDGANDRTG